MTSSQQLDFQQGANERAIVDSALAQQTSEGELACNKTEDSKAQSIAIVLMIKNEASSIASNLESLHTGGFNNFLILDTGSTDHTVSIANTYLTHNKLNAYLIEEPFIDFASSRNHALTLAKQYFKDAIFFLMPDAEWYLKNPKTLINFCYAERFKNTPLYLIKIKSGSLTFTTARLFRSSNLIFFKGLVHEAPDYAAEIMVPTDAYFEVLASTTGILKSKQRWLKDQEILFNEYKTNPYDPRTTFYLAQTFECLGEIENAFAFYEKRLAINGWDEENFITLYRLGCIALTLYKTKKTPSFYHAIDYLLQAFSMRSHRIEPLVQIADSYWPHNIQATYLFISYTYNMPFPDKDKLFIEQEMYNYTRYEIMSRCAWYMEQYSLGAEATKRALLVHPEMQHLQNNLRLYQEKLRDHQG